MSIHLTDTRAHIRSQESTWHLFLEVSRIPKLFMSKNEYTVSFPNLPACSSAVNGSSIHQTVSHTY